jgi:hypothetical protein
MAGWRIIFPIVAFGIATASHSLASEPAITTYGIRNAQAPSQLDLFSFLVGKWQGGGKTKLADGSYASFDGVTWIGRYVLNGMAIADEFHALTPEGKPYLGISLRQFDPQRHSWVIEYLNVSNSFLRRQVNPQSGSVRQDAGTIVVTSEDGQTRIREIYRVADQSHFSYSTDMSRDGGRTWDAALIEMTFKKVEPSSLPVAR